MLYGYRFQSWRFQLIAMKIRRLLQLDLQLSLAYWEGALLFPSGSRPFGRETPLLRRLRSALIFPTDIRRVHPGQ
jgi:hypothetical protein